MKTFHTIILMFGIVLLLTMESDMAEINILGLIIVWIECYNLKIFENENN